MALVYFFMTWLLACHRSMIQIGMYYLETLSMLNSTFRRTYPERRHHSYKSFLNVSPRSVWVLTKPPTSRNMSSLVQSISLSCSSGKSLSRLEQKAYLTDQRIGHNSVVLQPILSFPPTKLLGDALLVERLQQRLLLQVNPLMVGISLNREFKCRRASKVFCDHVFVSSKCLTYPIFDVPSQRAISQ